MTLIFVRKDGAQINFLQIKVYKEQKDRVVYLVRMARMGTGVNIIGGLTSEDELPTVGTPGDAYMIGGDLYVWQDDTGSWKNVGPIQGPEGKSAYDLAVETGFEGTLEEWIESLQGEIGPRGPEGPQGPPGQDADLTEITEQLDQLETDNRKSYQQ